MKKILNITSSINGEKSFSNKLSKAIVEKIQKSNAGSEVQTHDLAVKPLPHLESLHFTAFYTPEEARTEVQKEAVQLSDEAIKEVLDADFIVIGVGLYNLGIPSTLKAWIDHITRSGITFSYADGYPKGLLVNKKVYLAIASGAVFSGTALKDSDFTENYLRKMLGFLGITDVTVFRAEGTMMPEFSENAIPKILESIEEFAF
ncbi:NAD(P)H-dependent oxidoreductase [uncultured Flavobacterium sp.]|uniref:FMN-dependent NADH-azoreductase n=1 Tax=uncultured Flavobacterium sp. TaxID=165435 RepID=UPI0025E467D0|nr:NAD(P)H-dependent oxidoreductase [uncultured Flavobacterium sp.]